jgi:hypothetical protein
MMKSENAQYLPGNRWDTGQRSSICMIVSTLELFGGEDDRGGELVAHVR